VRGARVSLARIAFGPVEFRDVRASVNGAPLGTSLLGISTLERFRAWRVEDGTLTLEY
jgi:predicted aspartyl protease